METAQFSQVWTGFGIWTKIVEKYVLFSAVLHAAEMVPTRRYRTAGVMTTLWWVSSFGELTGWYCSSPS